MEMLIEKKEIQKFRSITQIGDRVYFLSNYGNELWLFDIKNNVFKMEWKLSERRDKYVLYRKIINYNDTLVFIPDGANDICVYNSRTKYIKKILIPDICIPYNQKHKFSNAFCIGNRIYFLPLCYPAMLVLDTDNWQISVQKMINADDKAVENEMFSGSYILQRGKCYVPSAQLNEVLEIDINTYEVSHHSLGRENTWYGTISFDGEYFWLTGGKNTITRWDIVHDIVEEYAYPPNFVRKEGNYPFLDSLQWMNKFILIPAKSNMFIMIDMDTNKIESIHRKPGESNHFLICTENEQNKVLYENEQNVVYFFKSNMKEFEQIKLKTGLHAYIQEIINDISDKHVVRDYSGDWYGRKIYSAM